MTFDQLPSSKPVSLREQKKLRLRAAVQETAIMLFIKNGYHAVSVDEIAKAVGVSRSTLFRYFVTKEAMVLYDSLDLPLAEAFRRQPINLTIVDALRATLREVLSNMKATDTSLQRQREALIRTVPELRATILSQLADNIDSLARLIAERIGKRVDDIEVCTLASALMGVMIGVLLDKAASHDQLNRFDEALRHLEKALQI